MDSRNSLGRSTLSHGLTIYASHHNLTSDADRVELYKGLVSFSGTYRVEGNTIVPTSTDVAWVPGYQYAGATIEITGNRLVTTSKPLKSPSTGREIVITTVAERME